MKRLITLLLLAGVSFSQEVRRPTADADNSGAPCSNLTTATSPTMTNAYDSSGTGTSASMTVSGTGCNDNTVCIDRKGGRSFSSWTAASGAYSSLTLNSSFTCTTSGAGSADCQVQYSLNSGTSWTALSSGVPVTLSSSQSLSQLQVRACAEGAGVDNGLTTGNGGAGSATLAISDIWTSGVIASVNNTRSASDTVTVSPIIALNNARATSDTLTASSSVVVIHHSVNSTSEAVGVSPSVSYIHNAQIPLANPLAITPAVTPNVGLHFSVSDSMSVADSVLRSAPRNASDSLSAIDTLAVKQTLHLSFAETISLSIAGVGSSSSFRSLSETVNAIDSAQRIQSLHLALSDVSTLVSATVRAVIHKPLLSESLNSADHIALGWTRQLPEAVIPIDVAIGSHSIRPLFSESLGVAPAVIGIIPRFKFFSESLVASDAALFVRHATSRQLAQSGTFLAEFSSTSKTPHAEINNIGQNLTMSEVLVIIVHSANKKKAVIVMSL